MDDYNEPCCLCWAVVPQLIGKGKEKLSKTFPHSMLERKNTCSKQEIYEGVCRYLHIERKDVSEDRSLRTGKKAVYRCSGHLDGGGCCFSVTVKFARKWVCCGWWISEVILDHGICEKAGSKPSVNVLLKNPDLMLVVSVRARAVIFSVIICNHGNDGQLWRVCSSVWGSRQSQCLHIGIPWKQINGFLLLYIQILDPTTHPCEVSVLLAGGG